MYSWIKYSFLALIMGALPLHAGDVGVYQKYLDTLKTMQGQFVQTNPDGSTQQGRIYLSRPGKLRLDYLDAPHQQLMADGTWIIFYDHESDEVNYTQIEDSPAYFLLKEDFDLSKDTYNLRLNEEAGVARITFSLDSDSPDQTITLVFDQKPLKLKQWVVRDVSNRETHVLLADTTSNTPIEDAIFVFKKEKF